MKGFMLLFLVLSAGGSLGQKVSGPEERTRSNRWIDEPQEGVIFYEGFENSSIPSLPSEWSSTSLSNQGFSVGTAGEDMGQTNENGYWPVPRHGLFAMTNDDVCDCNKAQDLLISKTVNAKTLTYLRLVFEAFQNGNAGQVVSVQAKSQTNLWTTIYEVSPSSEWTTHEVVIPNDLLEADFQFRFNYSDQGNYASGFAVDDIYLISSPTEDVVLSTPYLIAGNELGSGQLYATYPKRLIRQARWIFGAEATNDALSRKNARLHVDVLGPVAYSDSSDSWLLGSLESGNITFKRNQVYSPYETGNYTCSFDLKTDSTDSDETNNTFTSSFAVSDSLYSRISNTDDGTGIWLFGGGDRIGAVYHMFETDTIAAAILGVHESTVPGSRFRLKVFDYDTLGSSFFTTSSIQIKTENLGSTLRVPLGFPLTRGKYLVVVENETGSIVLKSTSTKTAEDGNALSLKQGQAWKTFPYFPKIDLIVPEVNSKCAGNLIYSVSNESCPGSEDGFIKTEMLDANNPWTYTWSNGAGNIDSVMNLSPGQYQVIVTDNLGCAYSRTVNVAAADSLAINPSLQSDSCARDEGSIELFISGGLEPYDINLNGSIEMNYITQLSKGTYPLNIADANGCTFNDTLEIDGTDDLAIAFSITPAGCGDTNGQVDVNPFGTGPFSYFWNNDSTTFSLSNISSGIYTLTLSDSIGCKVIGHAFVPDSNAPSIALQSFSDNACVDSSKGSININVTGGTSPYSYSWSNGSTDQDISELSEGIYTVEVEDNSGCRNYYSKQITESASPLVIDLIERGNICWEDETAILKALTSGGTEPYNYEWSTGSDSTAIIDLEAGDYILTVNDDEGCKAVVSSSVFHGIPMFVELDSVVLDTGGSILIENEIYISAFGGVSPLKYVWNDSINAEDLFNVPSAFYELKVTDQLGCTVQLFYNLVNYPTGIDRLDDAVLKAFPNPVQAGGILQIAGVEPIDMVELFDVHGRKLNSQFMNMNGQIGVQIPIIDHGIYLLRVTSNGIPSTQRILIYN